MTDIADQIAALDALLAATPDDPDALYRRGTLHWRLDHRAQALTDLNHAAALRPDGPAPAAAAHITAILDFTAPDLYNP